jgi:hypothetical protein
MALSSKERQELLSFNTGEPIIVVPNNALEEYEAYMVVIYVRTVSDCKPSFVKSVQLKMKIPLAYPSESPLISLHGIKLFHPNFTADGIWLGSAIQENETISECLLRLVRTIQFKAINTEHIGNRNAMAWYNKMKDSDIFPTDKVNYHPKPRISIIRVNESAF